MRVWRVPGFGIWEGSERLDEDLGRNFEGEARHRVQESVETALNKAFITL
jgi:hypothetical protein